MALLAAANGAHFFEWHKIAETGHIDCIVGKHATSDVYQAIVAPLHQDARP